MGHGELVGSAPAAGHQLGPQARVVEEAADGLGQGGGVPDRGEEPIDAVALAKAIRRLLDDPGLRAELVAGGRRRAEQLSMAHLAQRYDEIYRRLVTPA